MSAIREKPLVAGAAALGVLLAVGVATFAGPCVHDDGTFSVCHDASVAVLAAGIVAFVVSIAALFVSNRAVAGVLSLVAAVAGAFAALAPGNVLQLCMMQTMRCWTIMRPYALVCGLALFAVALIAAIRLIRAGSTSERSR